MESFNITLIGEPILVLNSKQDWIDKVPRLLPPERIAEVRIWIDRFGCCLSIGEDFQAAQDIESYPVTIYSLSRVAEFVEADKERHESDWADKA